MHESNTGGMMSRLRKARLRAGLTQEALAEKVGAAQSMISRWETRGLSCAPAMLAQLAQVLDVSSDYLLGLGDDDLAESAAA